MASSFTAYIDEAGDEGFKFLPNESGSSRWFVISAAVFRRENNLAPVEILKRTRLLLNKEAKTALHFRNLRHEQRLGYLSEIAKEPFRTVSVLTYKPDIHEPERYQHGKFLLYKYVSRLLLERISWLCRDAKATDAGDGTIDLVFSDRANMSYESLKSYLELLEQQSAMNDRIKIEWSKIRPANVRAVSHEKMAGLQVADAVASGTYYAAQMSQYGVAEPHYLHILRRHIYAHNRTKLGYGLKFWPDFRSLKEKMPHIAAFENV